MSLQAMSQLSYSCMALMRWIYIVLANQLNVINWVVIAYAIIDYFGRKYPNSRVFFLPILPRLKPLDNVEGLEFYIGKSEVYYEAFKRERERETCIIRELITIRYRHNIGIIIITRRSLKA